MILNHKDIDAMKMMKSSLVTIVNFNFKMIASEVTST